MVIKFECYHDWISPMRLVQTIGITLQTGLPYLCIFKTAFTLHFQSYSFSSLLSSLYNSHLFFFIYSSPPFRSHLPLFYIFLLFVLHTAPFLFIHFLYIPIHYSLCLSALTTLRHPFPFLAIFHPPSPLSSLLYAIFFTPVFTLTAPATLHLTSKNFLLISHLFKYSFFVIQVLFLFSFLMLWLLPLSFSSFAKCHLSSFSIISYFFSSHSFTTLSFTSFPPFFSFFLLPLLLSLHLRQVCSAFFISHLSSSCLFVPSS